MNISATYKGESVTIVDVDVNGGTIYVTYIDDSDVMKVSSDLFPNTTTMVTIATSATVN